MKVQGPLAPHPGSKLPAVVIAVFVTLTAAVERSSAEDQVLLPKRVPFTSAVKIDAAVGQEPAFERAVDGFSAEGTRASAYMLGESISKVEVQALGESGRTLLDFYWAGNSLLVVRERRIEYGELITRLPLDKPLPMHTVRDEWFEYHGSSVAGHFLAGKQATWRDKSSRQKSSELRAQARSFKRLMLAKPATADPSCRWTCKIDWGRECEQFVCK